MRAARQTIAPLKVLHPNSPPTLEEGTKSDSLLPDGRRVRVEDNLRRDCLSRRGERSGLQRRQRQCLCKLRNLQTLQTD
jgi:hypothetical protein